MPQTPLPGPVPSWPEARAVIRHDHQALVTIAGAGTTLTASSAEDARAHVTAHVAASAAQLSRPVRLATLSPDGDFPLLVHPDGHAEDDPAPDAQHIEGRLTGAERAFLDQPPTATTASAPPPAEPPPASPHPLALPDQPYPLAVPDALAPPVVSAWTVHQPPVSPPPEAFPSSNAPALGITAPNPATQEGPTAPEPSSEPLAEAWPTFLTDHRPEAPAAQGWRGALNRIGFRFPPGAAEQAERDDIHDVSQHWPGPRTVAVVNGRGGSGKTTTSVFLSAVLARYGGGPVLAWDNNPTRGSMSFRTEKGPHEGSILDLLPNAPRLLGTSSQSADLAHFVHHQTEDRFDVLRSKPTLLASLQRLSAADMDAVHAVAAKYYRLMMMDSGNDESDIMWLRMIDHTDQLVVVTNTRDDHAESAAWALKGLQERGDDHSRTLAAQSVLIVSQADPRATRDDVRRIIAGFAPITRAAAHIPWDPAIIGGQLRYQALRPDTRRAWLHAAALIAQGL